MATSAEHMVRDLLASADVQVGGSRPWDIIVKNPAFYGRILAGGSLAFGESYMDGWWECAHLDQFFAKIFSADLDKHPVNADAVFAVVKAKIFNGQTLRQAAKDIAHHYDIGNDFYEKMLDPRMQYTCGYWKDAQTLEQAQKNKIDLVCRKLQLQKGDHLLEIGSGWGGFAKYAAENYGVHVTGYTISQEQADYSRALVKGLPVEIVQKDYRLATGKFDKVVSIGMFEAVGAKNFTPFMQVVERCMKDDGLFLLHTIGGNTTQTITDPWINKYIFPGSLLPSLKQITSATEGRFVLEDLQNFGAYYDKTLMAWHENFIAHWPEFSVKYGERFYRMWQYYLLSCAGLFRARRTQLWQMVFAKKGLPGGYQSVR